MEKNKFSCDWRIDKTHVDRDLKRIITISALVLLLGGWVAFANLWSSVFEIIVAFFPFIAQGAKMAIEEYFTSPYFITGIIMSIASAFGIWFGVKGGKMLFTIISLITALLSLVSIGSNLL